MFGCRRFSGLGRIGSSFTPETGMNPGTCMWKERRIAGNSGSTRYGWLKAESRVEIRRLEALVSQNAMELRGAWDEYFNE
jgi:hypothetical protein